ncbi:hypothetical protein GJAV_G00088670 [Gymnothorax javanicus]|nr:hypothetical protein GJAV_G00088670 [Gymnothorax javanicus]
MFTQESALIELRELTRWQEVHVQRARSSQSSCAPALDVKIERGQSTSSVVSLKWGRLAYCESPRSCTSEHI